MIYNMTRDIDGILQENVSYESDPGDGHYYFPEIDPSTEGYTGNILDIGDAYGKIIVILGIIIYTVIFAVKYLKREFIIIFLTLLGPISCITYPIDKISDGKAQAFNRWLSEFIYNVLIQPFHLLLYVVLIGSAAELANANVIYAIVCFAVMIPAEKFIKEMFGFRDKLGSPLGAMMTGGIASQLFSKAKGGSSGGKVKKDKDDDSGELPEKVKTADLPGAEGREQNSRDAIADGGQDSGQGGQDGGDNEIRTRNLPEGVSDNNGGDRESGSNGADEADETAPEDIRTVDNVEQTGGDDIEVSQPIDQNNQNQIDSSQSINNPARNAGANAVAQNNTSESLKPGRWSKAFGSIRNKHNKKMLAQYGTLKHGFKGETLTKKRLWKATKGIGKWAGRRIKGAVTLGTTAAGMAAMGLIGTMMGRGKEGVALGAGLGRKLGNKVGSLADSAASKIGDYGGTFQKALVGKNKEQIKFKENKGNIERAKRAFKEDHNGRLPTGKQLDETLNDMYTLGHMGVQDSQLEDVLEEYHKNLGFYGGDEGKAMSAAIQSAYIAQDYKTSELRDEKKVQQIYDDLMERYKAVDGMDEDKAHDYIQNIIRNAGKLKRVEKIKLPEKKKKIPVPTRENFYGKWNAEEPEQEHNFQVYQDLVVELEAAGYNQDQIELVIKGSTGKTNVELISSLREQTEYLAGESMYERNPGQVDVRVQRVGATATENARVRTGGDTATPEAIRDQKIKRLEIKKATGIKDERVITQIQNLEAEIGTEHRKVGFRAIRGELTGKEKQEMSERELEIAERYKNAKKIRPRNLNA